MKDILEIEYMEEPRNQENEELAQKVIEECFKEEKLYDKDIYVSVIFTTPTVIRKINKEHRQIDSETDVLSFPMFEKEEIEYIKEEQKEGIYDVLGDIIISVERVKQQAKDYNHSFQRELSYMIVHGFYHLMGYDHMEEEEQKIMRQKEENILNKIGFGKE
jgi:probable rRNA maturation factor